MEPQDQAQITFRSEIHSIVFSVGQEGDCLEEKISRSGDFTVGEIKPRSKLLKL